MIGTSSSGSGILSLPFMGKIKHVCPYNLGIWLIRVFTAPYNKVAVLLGAIWGYENDARAIRHVVEEEVKRITRYLDIAEWVSKSDADFADNKTLLAQLREVLDLKKGQLIDTNKGALDIFKVEGGRVYYGFLATGETADEPMDEFMKKFNKEVP